MMSFFLNPWTFVAGALLVSLPIIIHLINRIRFRRVKWAAMEFLLKAQKRMRRRKILEQLLLLLLRCLMVFFVGVLFARYIGGCGGTNTAAETRPTTHVVILDDTPSMADGWRRDDGNSTTAFDEAKRLIAEKLMPATAEATTPQTMHILPLSNPDDSFPSRTKEVDGKRVPRNQGDQRDEARVGAGSIAAAGDYLKALQLSTIHRGLPNGLRRAKEQLDQTPAGDARVVHVVSDLRAVDWTADGPAISDLLRELKEGGATVHFIDVGNPARKPDRKSPAFSDNLAIVEFKPRNRVVSANQQVEMEVRVKNFGATDVKDVRIDFYLNGAPDFPFQSALIATLPSNQEVTRTVQGTLTRGGTKERPLDRFNLITAAIATPEPGGLPIDNARHAVVEVRDTVKVLIVDGRTVEGGVDLRTKSEGDSYYLRTLFQTKAQELGNIEVVNGDYGKLDKLDLRPFSTVYLMNVPALNDAAVKNLEKYVAGGGGVGVFLGPNVNPSDYNTKFYRGTAGFFPVPLQDKPKVTTLEQFLLRGAALTKRLLLRTPANRFHAALRRIYLDDRGELLKNDGVEPFFNVVNIDAHWPVSRRGAWRDDKSVQELYCLQNEAPIAEFEGKTVELVNLIRKQYNEPKFEKARKYLDGPDGLLERIRRVTGANAGAPLAELARLLDALLCDQINTGDESEPVLREFWTQPELVEAKRQATLLRDEAKYGDPLYIVKQFGRGRVAVMTTDAGGTHAEKKQWNDWPSLKGSPGWVVIVGEMQKYLSGGGDDANRSVGDRLVAEFDYARYEPTVTVHRMTADATKPPANRHMPVILKDLGKVTMNSPDPPKEAPVDAPRPPFQLNFADAQLPGAYLFTLTRKKETAPATPGAPPAVLDQFSDVDFLGVAFNVNAMHEGDLHRANSDDIAQLTSKAPLHNAEDLSWIDELKQKPSDLSSRRWIYLLLLLLLIAEQAWAVRISYHTKPDDLDALAPSAAAAYAPRASVMQTASAAASETTAANPS